jgi:hypothetical protein
MVGEESIPGGTGLAPGWPPWARRLASAAVLFHAAAILAGAWASQPSSELEQAVDEKFAAYHGLTRQGYSYRYYSPEPPPTPVIVATLEFRDGRPEQVVRIPDRATRPRMLYQRQLNLANWLMADVEDARHHAGDPARSRWARAFATHLGRTHPGCSSVTLRSRMHLVPPLDRVREDVERGRPVDLDAEEFYTTPERIGVFPCDAS